MKNLNKVFKIYDRTSKEYIHKYYNPKSTWGKYPSQYLRELKRCKNEEYLNNLEVHEFSLVITEVYDINKQIITPKNLKKDQ